MCRLFALHADQPVTARFWLLDAPYSLAHQSQFNADGTGIGWFDADGEPHVIKRPVAAHSSSRYARIASDLRSRAMIAHVRNSSGTSNQLRNTHPFLMGDIVFAHNGVLRVTDALRARVRSLECGHLVEGETDSEWLGALIAGETRARDGDLHAGILAAITWVLENVPVYSLNLIIAREEQLYALRLPETNELWVRDRPAGGRNADSLQQASDTLRATSEELRDVRSVVIASEPMDDSDQWRLLDPGELLHVTPDGQVSSERPFPALVHELGIADLGLSEAASQAHAAEAQERAARRGRTTDRAA